jgi:hypothetical protein
VYEIVTQFSDGPADTKYPQLFWCIGWWRPIATTAHDTNRGLHGSTYRSVVPDPAGTTTDGPTTTANAADATEASTLQALFTKSIYLD